MDSLHQRVELLERNSDELKKVTATYRAVQQVLEELSKKVEHPVVIPFLGSTKVLAHGYLHNTNEVIVQLGSDMFVKRTLTNALISLSRRVILAEDMQRGFDEELQNGQIRLHALKEMRSPSETKTLDNHRHDVEGPFEGVVKTAAGFLEIRERVESDSRQSGKMKLIEELEESKPPEDKQSDIGPNVSSRTKVNPSIFAKEFLKRT